MIKSYYSSIPERERKKRNHCICNMLELWKCQYLGKGHKPKSHKSAEVLRQRHTQLEPEVLYRQISEQTFLSLISLHNFHRLCNCSFIFLAS